VAKPRVRYTKSQILEEKKGKILTHFLVTGGAGFIGSNLVDALAKDPKNTVTVVDSLLTGFTRNVVPRKNVEFIKADVNSYEDIVAIFTSRNFDYVYHYAAVVGVQRTLDNPVSVLDDIEGIRNVLNLCKNTGVKRVLYASSSEVYGEPVEFPQNEHTTPLNSRLPYAVVKNIGECYLRSYHQEFGLDYTIFRFFNTYGPRQSSDFVMSRFIDMALANKDITVYGDGSQARTFGFVDDNIAATTAVLHHEFARNAVINIGNDTETTILELAQKIIKLTKSKSKIIHLPPLKEGDMTRRQPDASNMKKLLGRPLVSLDDGIKQLIAYKQKAD
jgi:nucleoside-diphosphate-sugar epimerase